MDSSYSRLFQIKLTVDEMAAQSTSVFCATCPASQLVHAGFWRNGPHFRTYVYSSPPHHHPEGPFPPRNCELCDNNVLCCCPLTHTLLQVPALPQRRSSCAGCCRCRPMLRASSCLTGWSGYGGVLALAGAVADWL